MSMQDDFDDAAEEEYTPREVFLRPMLSADERPLLDVMRRYMFPSGSGDYGKARKFLDEQIDSIQTVVLRGGQVGGFVHCNPKTQINHVFPDPSCRDKTAVMQAILDATARLTLSKAANAHAKPTGMTLAVPAESFTSRFWPEFHDAKGGATTSLDAPWGGDIRMAIYRIDDLAQRFTRTPAKVMDVAVPEDKIRERLKDIKPSGPN